MSVKWARCNVGANSESEYGKKFMRAQLENIVRGSLRLPTNAECEELCKLKNEWVDNYNGSGVNGRLFHGINSGEGNTLFIPAAGYGNKDSGNLKDGTHGCVWSSDTIDCYTTSCGLLVYKTGASVSRNFYHSYGYSVRLVG